MTRRLPWFPVYAPNWLSEAPLLSVDARAARMGIAAAVWHNGDDGELAVAREAWLTFAGMSADRFDAALVELQERGHVEVVQRHPLLRLRCPELVDDIERRRVQADAKQRLRGRQPSRPGGQRPDVPPDTDAPSGSTNGACPAPVQGPGQEEGPGQDSFRTDAAPSEPCHAPSASAGAPASAPSSHRGASSRHVEQPEPPNDLRPFERWWRLDAVPERERGAQARFVAGWEPLLSDLDRAYSAIDLETELAKAYAWETATPTKRKTPRGRPKFLRGWIERAQNSGAGR